MQLETQMREAAKNFEFERAAALRDRIRALKQRDLGVIATTEVRAEVEPVQTESAQLPPAAAWPGRTGQGPQPAEVETTGSWGLETVTSRSGLHPLFSIG